MKDKSENIATLDQESAKARKFASPNAAHSQSASPSADEFHKSVRHLADDHDEDEGFFERNRGKLIAVAVVLIGSAITYVAMTTEKSTVKKAPERNVVQITLPPPPAPPPPPPPPPKVQPPPPKEEKMIEQKPIEDTPKPPDKPADEPPAITTNIKGDGSATGVGRGKPGGGGFGGPTTGGGGGGRFDMYAGQVQTTVANALRRNPKTRSAKFNRLTVRIWLDATGRITQAKLAGSTGDPALDAALIDELVGSQLAPPPVGMPMPIVMRVSAQRN